MKTRYDIYEIPEDQKTESTYYLEDFIEGFDYPIILCGNREFVGKNRGFIDGIHTEIDTALDNADGACYYLAQKYPHLHGEHLCELTELCKAANERGALTHEQVAKWLTITLDEEYTYREIHGPCQGDWQGVYLWQGCVSELPYIEACYFGTGYEWKVQCDGDEWHIYTVTDRREEVSDEAGAASTDDVHIYRISGTHTVTTYDYEEEK